MAIARVARTPITDPARHHEARAAAVDQPADDDPGACRDQGADGERPRRRADRPARVRADRPHEHRERVVEDAPADDLGGAQRGERAAPGVHPPTLDHAPGGGQPVIDADFLAPSASVDAGLARRCNPRPVVGVRAGRGVGSGRGRSRTSGGAAARAGRAGRAGGALARRGAGGARAPGGGRPDPRRRHDRARGAGRGARGPARGRGRPSRRAPRGRGPAGRRHLQPQGLRPADPPVPGPVPLLHVRHGARASPGGLPRARRGPRDRPRRRRAGLHRGAVHPRRPPRGPLGGGPGLAGRAEPGLHARPRLRECGSGPPGDRAAAAPQPRRHGPPRAPAAAVGVAVDGDDARDHRDAALVAARRGALRLARQGARPAPPGDRRRRPRAGAVHHRDPRRHRRAPRRARPVAAAARGVRAARGARAGSDRPELPRQARHRDARGARRRVRRVRRRRGRRATDHAARGQRAGAAEPRRRPGRLGQRGPGPGPAAARRHRRLGRGVAGDPGPRQPRAPLAGPRRAAPGHRRRPGSPSPRGSRSTPATCATRTPGCTPTSSTP